MEEAPHGVTLLGVVGWGKGAAYKEWFLRWKWNGYIVGVPLERMLGVRAAETQRDAGELLYELYLICILCRLPCSIATDADFLKKLSN